MTDTIHDLVKQMLLLHFDDSTIIACLKLANIENPRQFLDDVIDETRARAILNLRVR